MFNFKFLRLFVRVAETGSIAAAAREFDIAPSIASRQVVALERAFDTRLITRTTRRLSLTPAGHALLEWARSTTAGFEELSDELGAMQHRPSGTIRLASNDYAAVTYLPALLARFCQKYPDVRVQMSTSNDPTRLLAGTHDLALHAGRQSGRTENPPVSPGALCRTVLSRAQGPPIRARRPREHDCLSHSASERLDWSFERNGRIVTQAIQPYVEVDNYLVLKELAFQGVGIARLSESLVREAMAAGTLEELLPDCKSVYADGALPAMWLVFADRRVLRRTRLLADFLARELSRR